MRLPHISASVHRFQPRQQESRSGKQIDFREIRGSAGSGKAEKRGYARKVETALGNHEAYAVADLAQGQISGLHVVHRLFGETFQNLDGDPITETAVLGVGANTLVCGGWAKRFSFA